MRILVGIKYVRRKKMFIPSIGSRVSKKEAYEVMRKELKIERKYTNHLRSLYLLVQ